MPIVTATVIALMGRKETPTDGVADYCALLGEALEDHQVELKKVHVRWREDGWLSALRSLWRDAHEWRGQWLALQYTAMGWSRRGFPFGTIAALAVLKCRGVHCAVTFHEARQQEQGTRWIDQIRGTVQDWLIRTLFRMADKGIFTIPIGSIPWLKHANHKAVFIPIGANFTPPARLSHANTNSAAATKTVAVFCVSPPPNRTIEIEDLAYAARRARRSGIAIEFVVFGKGAEEARPEIERALSVTGASLRVLGIRPADEIPGILSAATLLLFVYGQVAQTRSSALAGVACGLPIVGYSGSAAGTTVEEAGLELVPWRDRKALGDALVRVLTDHSLELALRERSRLAQEKYFSWSSIARQYVEALHESAACQPAQQLDLAVAQESALRNKQNREASHLAR
jgi:glycosyltransferase involved in cell wall biosynthesis